MKFKQVNIEPDIITFFKDNLDYLSSITQINSLIYKICGINNFFLYADETDELKTKIEQEFSIVEEPERREYGDFQTNKNLSDKIVHYIKSKNFEPEFILEPTCGKGNFIISCLKYNPSIKKIIGIEIYQPYAWETKFNILKYFIINSRKIIPEIEIIHANVFDFPFDKVSNETNHLKTLIIGNPPWITNSELGTISSNNLPQKANFKKHNGFDAITGKGNFDIGEYISLIILNNFTNHDGYFSFLMKNSVLKNIIHDQAQNNYKIADIEKLTIDSKKEFNVSVDACLFLSKLNQNPQYTCTVSNFYNLEKYTTLGWHNRIFVYSVKDYEEAKDIEGKSQFVWRQGVKHDCSKIMELQEYNNHYKNGINQEIHLENSLIYGLLKSSDLKGNETNSYRKQIIITQKKIGEDTNYIARSFPLTYEYLKKNKNWFDKRKSSIYKGKPSFSIFGIGDYSFAPYKLAISGLYKTSHFTLVLPLDNKPLMLDDTCYFIGFDKYENAKIAYLLLNHEHTRKFLNSITFYDSKRPITKDVLMRIDFNKLFNLIDYNLIENSNLNISEKNWIEFGKLINEKKELKQMTLF